MGNDKIEKLVSILLGARARHGILRIKRGGVLRLHLRRHGGRYSEILTEEFLIMIFTPKYPR